MKRWKNVTAELKKINKPALEFFRTTLRDSFPIAISKTALYNLAPTWFFGVIFCNILFMLLGIH